MNQETLFRRPDLQTLCDEADETIAKAKERFQPVATFALFSGGNDSTAMTHLARKHIDAVVHINTGIGIRQTTEFVHRMCEAWRLPIIELRTDPKVYVDIVLGPTRKGFPGPAFHYITYHRLKSQRLQEMQRDYAPRRQRILFISGVRRSESIRRMVGVASKAVGEPRRPLQRCGWANPIVDFDKAHLAVYRAENGIPQSDVAQRLGRSGECLCGAFARRNELAEIKRLYPEAGDYIESMQAEARRLGKQYPNWGWGDGERGPSPGPLCDGCALKEPGLFASAEAAGGAA